ncbi:MAG: response regulator [Symbiobacteriaceae bacterium]|nr:response regulator [Symbiobacteriaceae bacterium]
MQKTIFIVDDNDTNLAMAEEVLWEHYRVLTMPSGGRMFALLEHIHPDLILLDIGMPEMDGFEVLQKLKSDARYSDIPVMFLTSMTDTAVEVRGFELGVVDFITKPFSAPVLQNRINSHLNIDMIIRERTAKLQQLQNSLVFVLADMVENRDQETGGHVERTASYLQILLTAMLQQGVYADEIRQINQDAFISSARLHDVGKISISDSILNKPGKLTAEEFDIMKSHVIEGERIIERITARTGDEEFLLHAKLCAAYHHERWDGNGYPHKLQGLDIPLQGRMMAIVDVYDALISVRPYKTAFSEEEAIRIIQENAGEQFDPHITRVFCSLREDLHAIALRNKKEQD